MNFGYKTLSLLLSSALATNALAHGIYRQGLDAQTMGRAGIDVVSADTPTAAMTGNPAGLAEQENALQGTAVIADYNGSFSNFANSGSSLNTSVEGFPTAALVFKTDPDSPFTFGISAAPDAIARADWDFLDTTYGMAKHQSELITARFAVGAGWQVTDEFSLGATLGVTYNKNLLNAPYTFQDAGALTGAKVLLDLETDGFGPSFSLGANWDVTDWLELGVSYMSPTWLYTGGDANGFAPGVNYFTYNAEINQQLPQHITLGARFQVTDWLSILAQAEWVDYSRSFDTLTINLTSGSNLALPASFVENSPLRWKDIWIGTIAADVAITEDLDWSIGYSYGDSPLPASTLTPLTSAINEQTLGTGLAYRIGSVEIALAYQWDIPHTQSTNASILLNGEYQNSQVELEGHSGAVSVSWFY